MTDSGMAIMFSLVPLEHFPLINITESIYTVQLTLQAVNHIRNKELNYLSAIQAELHSLPLTSIQSVSLK